MAARQEAHEGFGAPLDRIAARLAHPLARFDIPVDLGGAQRLEGDDSVDDAHTRPPVDSHDAKPRIDMVPPAREQPEHAAQVRFIGRFFEDAAPDRDGGVARARSEEHTSELQSLMRISYAVFCSKKK